jgi:hypothetical protein
MKSQNATKKSAGETTISSGGHTPRSPSGPGVFDLRTETWFSKGRTDTVEENI